ncbi:MULTISPECIES: hypothetical protein [Burkholderia cepacia complex]|uniref:Uncharacterized protein n=3 Tax=Burkholderia cepacia complex TaxID=87882 RepID=A0A0H3KQT2_BURM1|nr:MULTISPECIES: hypothetical protein [Burkholderia cepacia complex]ABX19269.1 conserved hypothetical protein [Burkholderia multivorans ATCC 17616]AIO71891.1 hypothetical protein DM80_5819 [Burkholderia multivorans]MBJ9616025.1 hypothetical protein [Burkholderia multivorans]MBU9146566.1 hypothetical protein [Burkholderia multivorans]MBU9203958.1 hypothetical protein [Burkholderia multivorans]
MSEVLDLPVELANVPFEPVGKTIGEVAGEIDRALRSAGLAPEYVVPANGYADAPEELHGLRGTSVWPKVPYRAGYPCVSVLRFDRGAGVLVSFVGAVDGCWRIQRAIRIAARCRSHAWAIAAAVSRLFDLD